MKFFSFFLFFDKRKMPNVFIAKVINVYLFERWVENSGIERNPNAIDNTI